MRTSVVVFALSSLLALAPAPSNAAWPSGGLQVATPYYLNPDGRLVHDGTGRILSLVHNSGHSNWWVVNRVTPTGEYAAGWTPSGLNFYNDTSPGAMLAVSLDGGGGLWHVETEPGPTSGSDVVLDRMTAGATLDPAIPWIVAGSSAVESEPVVAADGGAGTFVAWWRNFSQLYLQHLTSTGAVQAGWPAAGKLLLNDFQFAQIRPALLSDVSGGALVLANGASGLRLYRVDATGATPAGWNAAGVLLDAGGATTVDLVRSDASHVFAVWTTGGRVVSQLVPTAGSGDPAWPGLPLELFSAAQSATRLDLVADGLGGLHALGRTSDGGARWQHVDESGALASGFGAGGLSPLDDDAVIPLATSVQGWQIVGAAGSDGGLIVCWRDERTGDEGVRARWLLADGTPDPAEPSAGRLIAADWAPYTLYALAVLGDGEAGAYVLWSEYAQLPYYTTAFLTRAYSSSLLGVEPPRGSTLALSLWPNPTREVLTARLTLPFEGVARLSLHDVAGRLVASREVAGAGEQVVRLDEVGSLAPGVYVLTLAQGAGMRRARVAVIR